MSKTCIVIPTYNERDNIIVLLKKILELGIKELNILVVDDNSPDGTGNIVKEFIKYNPSIKILERPQKAGLGSAYIAGFKDALKNGYEYIFEIDADLSHNPLIIPEFINKIRTNDLVIGSRYVRGGVILNWNFIRLLISKIGNTYVRTILNLPFHDLTSGYKCYRRTVLEKINLDELNSIGYNFQIETTYKSYLLGFKIEEIPIIFTERTKGKSKFSHKIILESFLKVLLLSIENKTLKQVTTKKV